jgi:hypothetical protein
MSKNPAVKGKPGDLEALRACLWDGVTAAHDLLKTRTTDKKLRAIHALSQSAAAYRAVLETADLEARIARFEAAMAGDDG